MEMRANDAFDVYMELYYEGGISSVYFWDVDDGFAGCVLLKKGMGSNRLFMRNAKGSCTCDMSTEVLIS